MKRFVVALGAVAANAGLFLVIAGMNVASRTPPLKSDMTLREVFHAALLPRPSAPEEEVPREVQEPPSTSTALPTTVATPEMPAPERFDLRSNFPGLETGIADFAGGPAVRTGTSGGGSPDGILGGVAGGIPGGTGVGPAVFSLAQVDRGPQRAVAPLPPYPAWARARRLEGVVTLRLTVDPDGGVREIDIESVDGDTRFGETVRQAVAQWRFEPAVFDGRKVSCVLVQRVRFQLVD